MFIGCRMYARVHKRACLHLSVMICEIIYCPSVLEPLRSIAAFCSNLFFHTASTRSNEEQQLQGRPCIKHCYQEQIYRRDRDM